MRFSLRRLAIALLPAIGLAAGAVSAAKAQTPDEIIKRGKVVIAIDTTVPPYGSLDATNQPSGIDIDVANAIGKQLKEADARGARTAIIIGPDDRARGEVQLKHLGDKTQHSVPRDAVASALASTAHPVPTNG